VNYTIFENIEFGYVFSEHFDAHFRTLTNPYWFVVICGLLIELGIVVDFRDHIRELTLSLLILSFCYFICVSLYI
jgi:hypothetical protein